MFSITLVLLKIIKLKNSKIKNFIGSFKIFIIFNFLYLYLNKSSPNLKLKALMNIEFVFFFTEPAPTCSAREVVFI